MTWTTFGIALGAYAVAASVVILFVQGAAAVNDRALHQEPTDSDEPQQ